MCEKKQLGGTYRKKTRRSRVPNVEYRNTICSAITHREMCVWRCRRPWRYVSATSETDIANAVINNVVSFVVVVIGIGLLLLSTAVFAIVVLTVMISAIRMCYCKNTVKRLFVIIITRKWGLCWSALHFFFKKINSLKLFVSI